MQIAEEVHGALPQVDFALFVLLMLVGRVGPQVGGWHWGLGPWHAQGRWQGHTPTAQGGLSPLLSTV